MNDKLIKELKEGVYKPLYIFVGEPSDIRDHIPLLREAITVSSPNELWKQLSSRPLFGMRSKVYVLHDNKEITKIGIENIKAALGPHTLILTYTELDKRSKFYKESAPYTTQVYAPTMDDIRSRVLDKFPGISEGAIKVITYRTRNIGHLELELNKLEYLPSHVPLTSEIVAAAIPAPIEDIIFSFIDVVAKRDVRRVFDYYASIKQEAPVKIISLLYTRFKHLLIVQSYQQLDTNEIAAKTKLSHFQIRLVRPFTNNYSNDEILKRLMLIQDTDINIKTGEINEWLGLEKLLIDILI